MAVVLYRVDERLIHGQVVVGWGQQLHPDRYAVVDDELAGSEWEQELYRLGVEEAEAVFVTVDEARSRLGAWQSDRARTVVLVRDLGTMVRLAAGGALEGARVNLGGIHHAPGRKQVLPYVHLGDPEVALLRDLEREGVDIEARDLPDHHPVVLDALIGS